MSTVAPPPVPPPAPAAAPDHAGYIDQQIRRTRRSLKLVDFSASLITLLVGLLAFLLAAAVIDHWVVRGGLSAGGRAMMFGVLILGLAWYCVRQFFPLLRPINPVFAAHTIERGSPSLKNSLLNLVMFRTRRGQMSARVYQAIEQQAAQRLSTATLEGAVDRSALLRLGYLLLLVVAICAAYSVLSPKSPVVSAGRILAPWANLAAPSRVQIVDVQPGDESVARGERVAVSAVIHGAKDDEQVHLHYASDDGQIDESLPMTQAAGAVRFQSQLPRTGDSAGAVGVQQDLQYWIEAGDARTRRFKLTVFSKPTIVVQKVHYEFPSYTGYPSKVVENTGDLRGIEGTRVTLEALANQPIKTAYVDFDADGRDDLKMNVDGDKATVSFPLELKSDRRTSAHASYMLRFTTTTGRTNNDPATYHIDVTADYPPEVRITTPEEPETTARANEMVQIGVEARDPDFALGQVKIVGKVGSREVTVADNYLTKNYEGRFTAMKPFTPADSQLKVGDVLEYWAVAQDNRRPDANVTTSDHRRLHIAGPADKKQPQAGGQGQQGQQGEQGGKQQEGQPKDGNAQQGEGGKSRPGEAGGDKQQQGNNSGEDDKTRSGQGGASGQGNNQAEKQQGSASQGEAASAAGSAPQDGKQQQSGAASQSGDNSQQSSSEQPSSPSASEQPNQSGNQSPNGDKSQGAKAQPQTGSPSGANSQPKDSPGGDQSQSGGKAGQQSGQSSSRVSSKGDDDGTAMERMAEHFDEQDGGQKNAGQQDGAKQENGQQGANQSAAKQDASGQQQPQQTGDDANKTADQSKSPNSPNDNAGQSGQKSGAESNQEKSAGAKQSGESPTAKPSKSSGAQSGASKSASQGGDQQKPGADGKQQQPDQTSKGSQQAQSSGQSGKPSAGGQDNAARPGADQAMPDKSGGKPDGHNSGQKTQSPDSATNRNQGNAGSGHSADDQKGSPGLDDSAKKPAEKTAGDNRPGSKQEEPPAGSASQKESNSKGGQSGDQSGGGQQGGGQHADAKGRGDAGQHEAADQGAGKADEQGQGETGSKAGDQQQAPGKTGQSSGDKPGAGSKQGDSSDNKAGAGSPDPNDQNKTEPPSDKSNGDEKSPNDTSGEHGQQPGGAGQQAGQKSDQPQGSKGEKPSGDQPPGQSGKQPSSGQPGDKTSAGKQSAGQQPGGESSPQSGDQSPQDKSGQKPPQKQGQPNKQSPGDPASAGGSSAAAPPQGGVHGGGVDGKPSGLEPEPGDAANLEYAKKQTDLVLERLDQQLAKKKVDPALLKSLGWNEDELRQFVDRWKGLKTRAAGDGPDSDAAKRDLDAALKSLGLRQQGPQKIRAAAAADQLRDLNEAYRARAPLEYADRVRDYQKGAASADKP